MTAGHNPASPRVGGALIIRCTGLIGQPRIAYRPNRLPVTRRVMTYILEIGDRRRLKGVSAFSTTQAIGHPVPMGGAISQTHGATTAQPSPSEEDMPSFGEFPGRSRRHEISRQNLSLMGEKSNRLPCRS